MPGKNVTENMQASRTDGAVLVCRTLVSSFVKDPARVAETAEMARHAQLLASKLQLPFADVQKVILAAWLSALEDRRDLIDPLVEKHGLRDILGLGEHAPGGDNPNLGFQILSLISGYQELKREKPGIEKDAAAVQKDLTELWAATATRRNLLNRFMVILRDELFLQSLETPGARILVVDPEEVVSSVLSLPLKSRGYQVTAVSHVQDALKLLAGERPDVIISEMKMLIDDGISLCQRIKAQPETRHIPFIMLTSSKSQRVARDCMKAGADEVIGRPVDMELLFIKLQKILGAVPAKPQAGVTGSLKDIQLSDLVQILCAGAKSTKVELTCGSEKGAIYIQNGDITEAEAGDLRREMAFYKVMGWKDGTFGTSTPEQFPPRVIQAPAMALLMEAARRNDEGAPPDTPPASTPA
jgi:CheY-like chemotaxis protein